MSVNMSNAGDVESLLANMFERGLLGFARRGRCALQHHLMLWKGLGNVEPPSASARCDLAAESS
jgi:hypothetical protein